MPASLPSHPDPLSVPHPLPVTIEGVRVVRANATTQPASLVINEQCVTWNEHSIPGADIVLHGIASDEQPKCVYAQLQDANEVRFIPNQTDAVAVIYRALSALAIVAEQAVQAQEAAEGNGDDAFYTRRPDGSVGMVSIESLLLASDENMERYADAEEDGEDDAHKKHQAQNGKSN